LRGTYREALGGVGWQLTGCRNLIAMFISRSSCRTFCGSQSMSMRSITFTATGCPVATALPLYTVPPLPFPIGEPETISYAPSPKMRPAAMPPHMAAHSRGHRACCCDASLRSRAQLGSIPRCRDGCQLYVTSIRRDGQRWLMPLNVRDDLRWLMPLNVTTDEATCQARRAELCDVRRRDAARLLCL
jgi:hypothetical protein